MNRKLPMLALSCIAAAAFSSCAFAAKAQVYKWVDASGVVHYADAPPPRGTPNVQTVRVTSSGDQVQTPAAETSPEPGSESSNEPSANVPASSNNAIANAARIMEQNCATARTNLDLLNTHLPVTTTDADGKQQRVDDATRQAKIADAQAEINLYCR